MTDVGRLVTLPVGADRKHSAISVAGFTVANNMNYADLIRLGASSKLFNQVA
jgi:hypothetical protein